MIKIENTEVFGFDAAIRGARNPMNSWSKSDSHPDGNGSGYMVGPNDLDLLKRLSSAGPDHGKYLRMIHVQCCIIAPVYFDAELDTYKVGTTRNSCSLQHKGMSKQYTINDFSVPDSIYEILDCKKDQKEHKTIYPYETEEFRVLEISGRKYRIYKNGKIVSEKFETNESNGRIRQFEAKEIKPSQNNGGYYYVHLGGKYNPEKWTVHRLVATAWIPRDWNIKLEVNHKDGNKGNNCVENLEWVSHKENERHKHENGLDGRTIRSTYLNYKASQKTTPEERFQMREMRKEGATTVEIAKLFNISQAQAYSIVTRQNGFGSKKEKFELAEIWEDRIELLNDLRSKYLTTGEEKYFLALRQIMPMGYNYRFTWDANYAVLKNIYFARKNHRLPEWHAFCEWIEELPYAKDLICC